MSEEVATQDKPDYEPPKANPISPEDFDGYEFSSDALGSKRHPTPEDVIKSKLDACVQVARTGAVIRGCAVAKISPHYRRKWMAADPQWAEALAEAEIMHKETCEWSARRNCFEGQVVYKRGDERDAMGRPKYVAQRKYGDPILAARLLAKMDEGYREKSAPSIGQIGDTHVSISITDERADSTMRNLLRDRYADVIDVKTVPQFNPALPEPDEAAS